MILSKVHHPSVLISIVALLFTASATGQNTGGVSQAPARGGSEQVADVLRSVKESVFMLRLPIDKDMASTGTGFLIGDDGVGLTNFHVVRSATSGKAVLSSDSLECDVELLAVDPGLDLALIRLVPPKGATLGKHRPLRVRADSPPEGVDVYALGFPKQLGYTVTRGIVSGVRRFDKMPEAFQRGGKYSPDSQWIQTDTALNPGNSGGPLVDASGQVVGICTWKWLDGASLSFALSAVHVEDFVNRSRGQTLGFAGAKAKFSAEFQTSRSLPEIQVTRNGSSREVMSAVAEFKRVVPCATCKGTGKVTARQDLGTGGGYGTNQFREVERQCTDCNGNRVGDHEKLLVANRRLVTALMRLPDTDTKRADSLRFAASAIKDSTGGFSRGLAQESADPTITQVTSTTPRIGSSVFFVGTISKDYKIGGIDERLLDVSVVGRSMSILCIAPQLVDGAEGDVVVVGGLLAGHMDNSLGEVWPVVQGGYVLKIDGGIPRK